MRVIRSLAEWGSPAPSVVTVGNFDGVHRGHQAILSEVRNRASQLGIQSVAVTFEPHPLKCIAPEKAPIPISTIQQKVRMIEDSGIDILLIQNFTRAFSKTSPKEFIEAYLVGVFNATTLCVGHNFRFGHSHSGDISTLRTANVGFDVVEVGAVIIAGQAVSSSRIRSRILEGRVREARHMLGHCYEIEGGVIAGKGRGRRLTVPTLNLDPENRLLPADGVYLTRVAGVGPHYSDSLTNIGMRPTFGEGVRTIETHLLESPPPVDTKKVRLRFLSRLREELKFPDAPSLRKQIDADRKIARRFFRRLGQVRGQVVLESASEGPS